jgi:hypothetical protein
MRKLRDHQLLVLLALLCLLVGAATVWATWIEFDTNEGLGMEGDAEFWSREFFTYCFMQLGWNTLAEWVGFIFILIAAAKLREVFEQEK